MTGRRGLARVGANRGAVAPLRSLPIPGTAVGQKRKA